MGSMTVELQWDDEMGPCWMNPDNLGILLFTEQKTLREFLQIDVLDHSDPGVMETWNRENQMKIRIEESLTQSQLYDAKSIARTLMKNGLSGNYFILDKKGGEIVKVKQFPVTWDIGVTNLKVVHKNKNEFIISHVKNDDPKTFLYDGEKDES